MPDNMSTQSGVNSDYRFGISLLSKENLNIAYNEEVMIDKATGEVLVKTKTGDTISYNFNSRLKSNIAATKAIANDRSVHGDIVSIEFDNIVAPCVIEFDKNYMESPLLIPYKCKYLLFNVDIDAITVTDNGLSRDRNNIVIDLEFAIKYMDNSLSEPFIISASINDLNSKVITIDDGSAVNRYEHAATVGIELSSFIIRNKVIGNIGTDNSVATIRPIFNSLFAVLQV